MNNWHRPLLRDTHESLTQAPYVTHMNHWQGLLTWHTWIIERGSSRDTHESWKQAPYVTHMNHGNRVRTWHTWITDRGSLRDTHESLTGAPHVTHMNHWQGLLTWHKWLWTQEPYVTRNYQPLSVLRKSSEKIPLGANLMRTHLMNCLATSIVEPGTSTSLKHKRDRK